MMDLKNKVVMVTGSRRGMGKAHALAFAKAGAKVAVCDISLNECVEVAKEAEKNGGEVIALKCDVTNKKEVDNVVKAAVDRWGRLDILVDNAGIAQFSPFLEITEEDWDRTINVNLKGYYLCAQAAAKQMANQKSGAIVNIASVAMGQVGIGFSNIAHYCASKGGIVAMTEALAVELAPYNIRVNAVAPGMIETPMIDQVKQDKASMERLMARVPIGRVGQPEEVSHLVLFLSSSAASYITGSTVVIDGGWLAA